MLTNPYFNQYGSVAEQRLVEDLVTETIFIYGMSTLYLPRKLVKLDQLFGEDTMSAFEKSYPIEMYFDSASGWEGDKSILSKFGLEIRKQANFVVSRRRFNEVITRVGAYSVSATVTDGKEVRPLEGDLIYIPMTKDLWEIKYVDYESVFYQLGKNYIWRITVEKFVYSNEPIQTGVADVDSIAARYKNLDSAASNPAQTTAIATEKDNVLEFTEENPFGHV